MTQNTCMFVLRCAGKPSVIIKPSSGDRNALYGFIWLIEEIAKTAQKRSARWQKPRVAHVTKYWNVHFLPFTHSLILPCCAEPERPERVVWFHFSQGQPPKPHEKNRHDCKKTRTGNETKYGKTHFLAAYPFDYFSMLRT